MRSLLSISIFCTLSFFCLPVSAGLSMCGYSEGDGINLSKNANGLSYGGCCHVSAIEKDVGTGKWQMKVKCSACYDSPLTYDTVNTFYSCGELRKNLK